MASRMRYLQTVLKKIRAEISTEELISNPGMLLLFQSFERQLREMEVAYVGTPEVAKAV